MTQGTNESDPQSVWQNQSLPDEPLSFDAIRRKAKRMDSRILRRACVFAAAVLLHLILKPAPFILGVGPSGWFDAAQFVTIAVAVFYSSDVGYMLEKRRRTLTLSRAMSEPSLVFCREQLIAITDTHRLKIQLVLLAVLVAYHAQRNPALVLSLGGVATILVYSYRKRQIDQATRELAALAEFRKSERNL